MAPSRLTLSLRPLKFVYLGFAVTREDGWMWADADVESVIYMAESDRCQLQNSYEGIFARFSPTVYPCLAEILRLLDRLNGLTIKTTRCKWVGRKSHNEDEERAEGEGSETEASGANDEEVEVGPQVGS
ncbi:hypothetical protein JAAARDRAFT_198533 [Jaapia argillacea MUCL 33604]|uniref:Uncharacterized protein n=1 Tax=Jaapia argillacea MUCL 33604 TaxID=933084 RepID=A0A067PBH6_9AGAM|nr:hypothetical protein JAAARDRAFT_198533 [Jaapia argillacea MUCL 33604]